MQQTICGEIPEIQYVKCLSFNDILKTIKKKSDYYLESIFSENKSFYSFGSYSSSSSQGFFYTRDDSHFGNIIFPILKKECFEGEGFSAGSSDLILEIFFRFFSNFSYANSEKHFIDLLDTQDYIFSSVFKNSFKCQKSDMYSIIDNVFKNERYRELVKNVIDCSSYKTVAIVERSNRTHTIVKKETGYSFSVGFDCDYFLGRQSWIRKDVNVLVIDGFIESLGEIHHLLEKSSNEKEPYVIFLRGMSDEVKYSIIENLRRGTVDIFPICVGFDENTLNVLNDVSIGINSYLVSSTKGDLISTSCQNDLKKIKRIEIYKNKFLIPEKIESDILTNHLEYLRRRLDDAQAPELKSIFNDRLKSLTGEKILIRIGKEDQKNNALVIQKLDCFFRTIRSIAMGGLVDPESIEIKGMTCFENAVKDTLLTKDVMSARTIAISIKKSISIIKSLISIEKVLIND